MPAPKLDVLLATEADDSSVDRRGVLQCLGLLHGSGFRRRFRYGGVLGHRRRLWRALDLRRWKRLRARRRGQQERRPDAPAPTEPG